MPRRVDDDPFGSPSRDVLPIPSTPSRPDTRMKNGQWRESFLDAIRAGCTVTGAAAIAGVHFTLPYQTRARNEEFRKAWEAAADIGTALLEEEAVRRAYHGTDHPVFYKGQLCGSYKEYDNKLLMDLLKVRKPEKYKNIDDAERSTSINININMDVVSTRAELDGNTASVIDVEVVDSSPQQESARLPETAPIHDQ